MDRHLPRCLDRGYGTQYSQALAVCRQPKLMATSRDTSAVSWRSSPGRTRRSSISRWRMSKPHKDYFMAFFFFLLKPNRGASRGNLPSRHRNRAKTGGDRRRRQGKLRALSRAVFCELSQHPRLNALRSVTDEDVQERRPGSEGARPSMSNRGIFFALLGPNGAGKDDAGSHLTVVNKGGGHARVFGHASTGARGRQGLHRHRGRKR